MKRMLPFRVFVFVCLSAATNLSAQETKAQAEAPESPAVTGPAAPTANSQSAVSTQHSIAGMRLVGPGFGWALVDGRLLWTSDDGKDWRLLTPGATSQHIDGVFFLDAYAGWVVLSQKGSVSGPEPKLTVAHTHDGGSNWTASSVEVTPSERLKSYAGTSSIFFLDQSHGWLTIRLASSSNFSLGLLFATQDGGRTWVQLSDPPAADPVYFSTPLRGWIAGGPGGDRLWTTQDGGKTWREQTLEGPAESPGCTPTLAPPSFQSPKRGLLAVACREDDQILLGAYTSEDGGQSWDLGPAFERGDSVNAPATAVVDRTLVRVYATQNELVTFTGTESGSYAALPSLLWPAGAVAKADFASEANGWILYSSGECIGDKWGCSQQNELLSTEDGGSTYNVITPSAALLGSPSDDRASGPAEAAPPSQAANPVSVQNVGAEVGSGSSQYPLPLDVAASGQVISQGEGFDQCRAGTASQMQDWWGASPYTTTGIYIGGANRSCSQPNLSIDWVSQVTTQGWGLMALWVGKQAPTFVNGVTCSSQFYCIDSDPATAAIEGEEEADNAIEASRALGLDLTIIYFDMESYSTGTSASAAVSAFIDSWVQELHKYNFRAGVYANAANAAADMTPHVILWNGSAMHPPAALWFPRWDDNNDSVWDSVLSNSLWRYHQRVHQWCSDTDPGHTCTKYGHTWGGVTFTSNGANGLINGDVLDGPVVPSQAPLLLAPVLQSPFNGATFFGPPTFKWSQVSPSSTYRIAIATSTSVLPIATDALTSGSPSLGFAFLYPPYNATLPSNSYTPAAGTLTPGTKYYWTVQARGLQLGAWSPPSVFTMAKAASAVNAVQVSPSTLMGGSSATVVVTLDGICTASGGCPVQVSSNNAAFPSTTVTVPLGQSTGNVQVVVGSVGSSTAVTVTATYGGTSQSTIVTLQPGGASTATAAATSLTASGAVLNGTINPAGDSGSAYFQWGTDPTLTASNTNFSCASPCSVLANSTAQSFSLQISGLASNITYYFRTVFYDAKGPIQYGNIVSFTTLNPAVTTSPATSLTASGAVLNGTINPGGDSGSAYFQWGTDPTLSASSTNFSCATPCNVVAGYTVESFSLQLSRLTSNTPYYFRMVFYDGNNGSRQYGAILSFTTLTPAVTTSPTTSLIASGAVLNGTINPAGDGGSAYFYWGTDPKLRTYNAFCASSCSVLANFAVQSFSLQLSGLASNTPYYFRMVFYDNNGSQQYGTILSFTTLNPSVTALPATSITASGAVLNGSINPNGDNGSAFFYWGTDPTLTTYYTACASTCTVLANSTVQSFSLQLSGLTSKTTYYFLMVFSDARNGGYTSGYINSFTTQ